MKHPLQSGLRLKAMAWLVLGRPQRAQAAFDAAVRRFGCAYARASRAHLLAQSGCFEAAIADYRVLLEQDPADARNWFNCAFVLESMARWDDALAAFREATRLSPKLDRAWYGQALVLIRLRRFDEAVEALTRNTTLQPMSPHGWYQLARVHAHTQRLDEATRIIRHLWGFEPKVAAQLERETGLRAAADATGHRMLQQQGARA